MVAPMDVTHGSFNTSLNLNYSFYVSSGTTPMFETASSPTTPTTTNQTKLDSHADTSVAGAYFRTLFDTGEYATVHIFSNEKKPFDKIPIGTAATAWTDRDGQTYILRLNQALLFGDRLDHSLLCPNQLRHFGNKVDDVPVQFDQDSTYSILLRSEVDEGSEVTIPLMLKELCHISLRISLRIMNWITVHI